MIKTVGELRDALKPISDDRPVAIVNVLDRVAGMIQEINEFDEGVNVLYARKAPNSTTVHILTNPTMLHMAETDELVITAQVDSLAKVGELIAYNGKLFKIVEVRNGKAWKPGMTVGYVVTEHKKQGKEI